MLCLREQVGGDPLRVRAAVRHAAHFRRPGDHVDAYGAKDQTLCHSDEGIARADDLKYRLHGFRAIGQHSDALGAADFIDFLYTGHVGSGEDVWIHLAIFPWRRRHSHRRTAGYQGRHRVHEHRGRIGRAAAGHIHAHALDREKLLAQFHAVSEILRPGLSHLLLVEGFDICLRFFEDV